MLEYCFNFQVFYDKMRDSQQEIKATVTVNTSDIAAKAHENKEQGKDLDKLSKKRASGKIQLGKFIILVVAE